MAISRLLGKLYLLIKHILMRSISFQSSPYAKITNNVNLTPLINSSKLQNDRINRDFVRPVEVEKPLSPKIEMKDHFLYAELINSRHLVQVAHEVAEQFQAYFLPEIMIMAGSKEIVLEFDYSK